MKNSVVIFVFLFLSTFSYAQAQERCGIENCHGIDILCGPNVAEVCNMMYGLGDFCREYARCEVRNGDCVPAQDPTFELCSTCVRQCMDNYPDNPVESFNCEAKCQDKIAALRGSDTNETEAGVEQGNTGYGVESGAAFEGVEEGNYGMPSE